MIENYFLALLDWWRLKFVLRNKQSRIVFNEGEVWWCSMGLNIGEEVYGKGAGFARPILVFKKFTGNSFWGLPFTGSEKQGDWYVPIDLPNQRSSIMLNQARAIDKKRLRSKMTIISADDFQSIRTAFHELYC